MAHQNGGFQSVYRAFRSDQGAMRFVDPPTWLTPLAHTPTRVSIKPAVVVMDGRGAWGGSSIWYATMGARHVLTIFRGRIRSGCSTHSSANTSDSFPTATNGRLGPGTLWKSGVNLGEFISLHEGLIVSTRLFCSNGINGTVGDRQALGPERTPESEIDDSFKEYCLCVQDACEDACWLW